MVAESLTYKEYVAECRRLKDEANRIRSEYYAESRRLKNALFELGSEHTKRQLKILEEKSEVYRVYHETAQKISEKI